MYSKNIIKVLIVLLITTTINIQESTNGIKKERLTINKIQNKKNIEKNFLQNIEKREKYIYDELLATISIKKINLINKPIYNKNSKKNNIEKNITILKESSMPDNNSSIIFLLAHSGIGEKAYFKNIHKLEIEDTIDLMYNKKNYTYKIKKIYEDTKDGYLKITKEYQKELILTTCSQNKDKLLIIIATP
ncbi:MAG: sortase [Bacilli bacterium]|nr:sortase [Bacilli bacterium]